MILKINRKTAEEYGFIGFLTKESIEKRDKDYPITSSKEFINITDELEDYFRDAYTGRGVPVDMFLSNHIPAKDIVLQYDESNEFTDLHVSGRLYIAPPTEIKQKIIDLSSKNKQEGEISTVEIGIVRIDVYGDSLYNKLKYMFPIYYAGDEYGMVFTSTIMGCCDDKSYKDFKENYFKDSFESLVDQMRRYSMNVLYHWYMIQTLLLNPVVLPYVKTTVTPVEYKQSKSKKNKKKKQPPKKYIKRILLDMTTLNDLAISYEKPKIHHKEPIWWVSGHFRKYKSGKVIWVDGYWKGPERLKAELPEPRERVLPEQSEVNSNSNLASLLDLMIDESGRTYNC